MFVLMALGLLAQGGGTAEETFKRIEETVVKAKTLRVKFACEAVPAGEGRGGAKCSGTMLLKKVDKAWVAFEIDDSKKKTRFQMTCDGTRMRTKVGEQIQEKPKQENLQDGLAVGFVRAGCFILYLTPVPKENKSDLRGFFKVSDFRKGEPDGEAATLTFKVKVVGTDLNAKLWYDPKTHRPLKRTLGLGPERGTVTETYEAFVLDEDIPDERFELKQP